MGLEPTTFCMASLFGRQLPLGDKGVGAHPIPFHRRADVCQAHNIRACAGDDHVNERPPSEAVIRTLDQRLRVFVSSCR